MGQDEALVSVLMTNYNYGKYIEQAVNSVVAQTHGPLELIIVDDGSTDNSREAIERLKAEIGSRFSNGVLVVHKTNGGLHSALNAGFQHVNGETALFLDADDMISPEYIAKATRLLWQKRQEGVGLVYTNSVMIHADGTLFRDLYGNAIEGKSAEFDAETLARYNYIPGNGVTLTDALRQIFPLDLNVEPGREKHARHLALVASGYKFLHIPEPLFFYRQHRENISGIGNTTMAQMESGTPSHFMFSGLWPKYDPNS